MSLRVCVTSPLALVLSIAASVLPASADSIRITSGALAYPPTGGMPVISLNGEDFTFTASTSTTDAYIKPFEQCSTPDCHAGTTVGLDTRASGSGLRGGTATYQGTTYQHFEGFGAFDPAMILSWDGSVVIPTGFTGGTLTAPFAFSGVFTYWTGFTTGFQRLELFGSGTASVTLEPYSNGLFPGSFRGTGVRFDFDAPAATPEPASLVLLGTGLAGLVAARRRRHA